MDTEFSLWLCYIKLLVCDAHKNSCQWDLVYCSLPAEKYNDLVGFQNEQLTIIAIFKFHPINRCAIAEIDVPEEVKASIRVLMIEDNLLNFSILAKLFIRKVDLVPYYGFDVETVMQIVADKQVDIIIVNSGYGGRYEEVDWTKHILILKSNPETTQIPIILKWGGQFTAVDEERFLASGVDDLIQGGPGNTNSIIEKIQHTLSANNSSQNKPTNLENKVSNYRPVEIQGEKEYLLEVFLFKIYQIVFIIGYSIVFFFGFLKRLNPFRKKYK